MPSPQELAAALRIGAGQPAPTPQLPERYWTDQALFTGLMAKAAPGQPETWQQYEAAVNKDPGYAKAREEGGRAEISQYYESLKNNPTLAKEFYKNTGGWFHGADGAPRLEIDDSKATFDPKGTTLATALRHPELFKKYPQLANVPVSALSSIDIQNNIHGRAGPNFVQYNPARNSDDNLSTLLHEAQHMIQKEEGWEGGSSPEWENRKLGPGKEGWALTNYLRNMGEVEARHVQNRRGLTPQQRKDIYPPPMEDVPRPLQGRSNQPITDFIAKDFNLINEHVAKNPDSQFSNLLRGFGVMR